MRAGLIVLGLLALGCTESSATSDAAPIDAPAVIEDPPIDAAVFVDARPPADGGPEADAPEGEFPCNVRALTNKGVNTLAGCTEPGTTDGDRSIVRFNNPVGVAHGADGDVYVADYGNNRIRAVRPNGNTRTVVNQAGFRKPFGLAFAANGNLYVATDENDRGEDGGALWLVDRTARTATLILRDVGHVHGMAGLPDGRVVLSDPLHHVVRVLSVADGDAGTSYAIADLAGGVDSPGYTDARGAAARFNRPSGVAVLPDGRVAVADQRNNRVRAIALDGTVTTIAGNGQPGRDDGAAGSASFKEPEDVATDDAGNIYVADVDNHVIRKIGGGQVMTVAGSGIQGWMDNDDLAVATFFGIEGIDASADGKTVWVADGNQGVGLPYHRVRVVRLP